MMMQEPPAPTSQTSRFIMVVAAATIVAGSLFVVRYPRELARQELDAERMMKAQDLEQALEWYLIRQAKEKAENEQAAPSVQS